MALPGLRSAIRSAMALLGLRFPIRPGMTVFWPRSPFALVWQFSGLLCGSPIYGSFLGCRLAVRVVMALPGAVALPLTHMAFSGAVALRVA